MIFYGGVRVAWVVGFPRPCKPSILRVRGGSRPFFQCTHDGADVFGCASDPFGELVTRDQDFARILPDD